MSAADIEEANARDTDTDTATTTDADADTNSDKANMYNDYGMCYFF